MRSFKELLEHIYNKNNIDFSKCQNLSLALNKFIKKEIVEQTKEKSKFLNAIKKVPKVIIDFKNRISLQVESLKKQGYINIFESDLKLKTSSRLVIGLGSEHVLETSLTLHHTFGIPYIPSSALKGVVRMVSFWEIAQNLNKKIEKELEELQEQLYDKEISNNEDKEILKHKLLFGTQSFKGLLVFLDAYPLIQENQEIFELDIMNVHYKSYYTQNGIPGDWESPTPITFLTVKEGVEFCFYVLFDEHRANLLLGNEDFSQNAKNVLKDLKQNNFYQLKNDLIRWVEKALKEFGVGAKTRLGYGIFN